MPRDRALKEGGWRTITRIVPSTSSEPCLGGRAFALVAAVTVGLAPPATAASPTLADAARGDSPVRLSDERTFTRWTTALERASIHVRPARGARTVARLRWYTEDGQPEIYVGLAQTVGADGRAWVRIRVPRRPNGTTGWVPRTALNGWRVARKFLLVDRRRRAATLYRGHRVLWRARVGVGRPATPTPAGRFYVRERISNLAGSPVYGPVAFGTSAYSGLSEWPGGGVIGIHGTNQPRLIPGRVSHGCVRVRNRAIRRLARLMPVGTPVRIVGG